VKVALPVSTTSDAKEEFVLAPLDHMKDEPKLGPSFHRLLDMLQTRADWEVVPGWLEGVSQSGRRIRSSMTQKLVRRAASAGRLGIIMECFHRVGRTGLRLEDLHVVREVILGALARAMAEKWSEMELDKALKAAERALDMAADPRHMHRPHPGRKLDPQLSPDVFGAVAGLFATKAVRYGDGTDKDGKVERYARRLLDRSDDARLEVETDGLTAADRKLLVLGPTWYGMKLAARVLGEDSEVGSRLARALKADVEPKISEAREIHGKMEAGASRRGIRLLEGLEASLA
jgi:hypothetical protein